MRWKERNRDRMRKGSIGERKGKRYIYMSFWRLKKI